MTITTANTDPQICLPCRGYSRHTERVVFTYIVCFQYTLALDSDGFILYYFETAVEYPRHAIRAAAIRSEPLTWTIPAQMYTCTKHACTWNASAKAE